MSNTKYVLLALATIAYIHTFTVTDLHNEVDLLSDRFKSFLNHFDKPISDVPNLEDRCQIRPDLSAADFYYFLPALMGKVIPGKQDTTQFSNSCFKNNKVTLEKFSKQETIITMEVSDPKNFFCHDQYVIATAGIHEIKQVFIHGKHRYVLKNLSDDDIADVTINGLNIFTFCQDFFTSMKSIFDTLKLYVGGLGLHPDAKIPLIRPGVPEYMEKSNVDFLGRFAGIKLIHRGEWADKIIDIDESQIKTGDFIAIYRLDGLDPLIMIGTGSHIGHSAVATWIDGQLYVTESQDGWYWPKKNIQRNLFKDWVKYAHAADFNVAILPLKEEVRAKFNEQAAVEFFKWAENKHYGYHNFLFNWLDTPDKNFPSLIDPEAVFVVFTILEKITRSTSDTIMGEALNQRLNTKGLSIAQTAAEAARRGLTWGDLMALPEVEGWKYSDGENYVCSCYVVGFYKAGGIFGDIPINSTEFSPKDVYQLDIFDRSYKDRRPDVCKQADPELEYCQIMGKYKVNLPGYSTIAPYPNMNERCPSQAPEFYRPDGC
jgi:hypothetical protein